MGRQRITDFFCAGALPDDCLPDRGTVRPIPRGNGFALVAYAHCRNLCGVNPGLFGNLTAYDQHICVDFLQIVADPAFFVDILPMRSIGTGGQATRRIKQHSLGSLRALVNR